MPNVRNRQKDHATSWSLHPIPYFLTLGIGDLVHTQHGSTQSSLGEHVGQRVESHLDASDSLADSRTPA